MSDIEAIVVNAYQHRYPNWKQCKLTEIVLNTYGGHLAVVKGLDEDNEHVDEVCFITLDGKVETFSTTEELIRFLEHKTKLSFFDKLFTRNTISGIVLLSLLLGVFLVGTNKDFNQQALTIIGSIAGMSAGYFFGNKTS